MADNLRCPRCKSERKIRRGFLPNKVRYQCKNCGKYYSEVEGKLPVRIPKILVFDIETAPLRAFVFQKSVWGGNVTDEQVISEWFMLCWSAKWLFDEQVMSERLTGAETLNEDDSRIVQDLWTLFNEAEIIIAHNGDSFDVPNMNTRFILNNLPPPLPYQTIDTKTVAKRQFGFTHNSLNGLAKIFGFSPKIDVDFSLWKRCYDGDDKALEELEIYNRDDVRLLEEIYLKLRPWIKSHPNLGLYMLSDGTVCPNCGGMHLTWLPNQYYYTQAGRYPLFRCECGAYGRSRSSDLVKSEKEKLVTGLAK